MLIASPFGWKIYNPGQRTIRRLRFGLVHFRVADSSLLSM